MKNIIIVGLSVIAMVIFITIQDEIGFWLAAVVLVLGSMEIIEKQTNNIGQ
jgi:UPF0716 family protein affecting phage T7 exclusion